MEVVPPPGPGVPRVVFGTLVTVREAGGAERAYRIVGVDESDPGRGALSWISPVARSLTGKRPGDQVRISLPAGEQVLTILSIEPIPEAGGISEASGTPESDRVREAHRIPESDPR